VGCNAKLENQNLVLKLGYSHSITFPIPEKVVVTCPSVTEIVVSGIDKELVGRIAATIREFRPPIPYPGK
jgi:large subunit ribosomal protein L6